jgi:hypothetical protein
MKREWTHRIVDEPNISAKLSRRAHAHAKAAEAHAAKARAAAAPDDAKAAEDAKAAADAAEAASAHAASLAIGTETDAETDVVVYECLELDGKVVHLKEVYRMAKPEHDHRAKNGYTHHRG